MPDPEELAGPAPTGEAEEAAPPHRNVTFPPPAEDRPAGEKRFWPPSWRKLSWRRRHGELLIALEWVLCGLCILFALYFLWLLLFSPAPAPGASEAGRRAEFRARLRALPPPAPDPAWRAGTRPDRWRGIVVHHTATDGGDPVGIDRHHREVNHWKNGLGYHFLIGNGKGMADGEIASSRRWREQDELNGAHVIMADQAKETLFNAPRDAKANDFAIGVALVGNFEKDWPTPAQLASLRSLLTFLRNEFGIGLTAIVGHGQVANGGTACPGRLLLLDEVILALANP